MLRLFRPIEALLCADKRCEMHLRSAKISRANSQLGLGAFAVFSLAPRFFANCLKTFSASTVFAHAVHPPPVSCQRLMQELCKVIGAQRKAKAAAHAVAWARAATWRCMARTGANRHLGGWHGTSEQAQGGTVNQPPAQFVHCQASIPSRMAFGLCGIAGLKSACVSVSGRSARMTGKAEAEVPSNTTGSN